MASLTGISENFAKFIVDYEAKEIPDSAQRVLLLSIFDWICVGYAGVEEDVSKIVRNFAVEEGGNSKDSSIFGSDKKISARAAAMINGTTSHALDYDDTHFCYVGHPSVAVLPATLALSEKFRLSGQKFVEASLIGLESACRIGSWLGRGHYQKGFHQTATAGTFGSTLGGCRLLDLDFNQTLNSIGIASTRASGLKSQFGTMGKPFNAGIAAANGIEASQLAKSGFVSRPDGLECFQGFADTHAGDSVSLGKVLDGLGKLFIFENVLHKYHACCHGLHASIEAILELQRKSDLDIVNIKSVKILANPRWESVCNIDSPKTELEAKFSFRQTIAMAIYGYDTAKLTNYSAKLCKDELLASMRERIHVEFSESFEDTASTVIIEDLAGDIIESSHDLLAPVELTIRESRVLSKGATLIGKENAGQLWGKILTLPKSDENMYDINLLEIM